MARLTPEEMRILAAARSIKGAGKITVTKTESGQVSVQTHQQLRPVPQVRQSDQGKTMIQRLRG